MQLTTLSIDRSLRWTAVASVSILLFFPMIVVAAYLQEPSTSMTSGAAEATVGVGVILRAIGRRLFRAGAQNVVRVTFGTMSRALSRTALSRVVKLFVRSSVASELKDLSEDARIPAFESTVLAVGVGALATAISFGVVVTIATSSGMFNSPLPIVEMAIWSALPLVVVWLTAEAGKRLFQVLPQFSTGGHPVTRS